MAFVVQYPNSLLALLVVVLAVPALILAQRERTRKFARAYTQAIVGAACLLALGRAAVYLVRLRPSVGGVDFFGLLCVARDRNQGATDLSPWRYAYFPGAQAFWRIALRMGGDTLAGVQWVYTALLAGNASLLAATAWRTTRSRLGAAVCAIGYVTLVARLEGGYGMAEPIATLPVVAAVSIWAGESLRGRRGLVLAAVLGAGIGLGVYVKQQGAIEAVGWLSLPITNLLVPPERRHQWRAIAIVPAAAAITFATGILAEGQGLLPLEMGLRTVLSYASDSNFWRNVTEIASQVRPLLFASLFALPAAVLVLASDRASRTQPWFGVATFALLVSVGSLYPLVKRAYHHYALLGAPWMLLAVVLSLTVAWRRIPRHDSPALRLFALLACALPFVHSEDRASNAFFLWPPAPIEQPRLKHAWLRPLVAQDLRALSGLLHRGEDVLVLPPRHNEIHYLLGTRSVSWEQGYTWGVEPSRAAKALSSKTLAAVVVLTPSDPDDAWTWKWHECDQAVKNLRGAGFHLVAELKTMTVWRR